MHLGLPGTTHGIVYYWYRNGPDPPSQPLSHIAVTMATEAPPHMHVQERCWFCVIVTRLPGRVNYFLHDMIRTTADAGM